MKLPFLFVRNHVHRKLFGRAQPAVDLWCGAALIAYGISRQAKLDKEPYLDLLKVSPETAWTEFVSLDRAPPSKPVGSSCFLYSSETDHNMLAYRIPAEKGGGLVLHNCVFLDDAQLLELQAMGPIKAILCPNHFEMSRCMHFGAKLGVDVYMSRPHYVSTLDAMEMHRPAWREPRVAEESQLEERFGVKVHEPAGTQGHNRDGADFPAENIYEFRQPDGSCVLACGIMISDTNYPWRLLPLQKQKMDEVTIPGCIFSRGLTSHSAFEGFLQQMYKRKPTHIIPAVGAVVDDPATVLLKACEKARARGTSYF